MIEYIYRDMMSMLQYLPWGLLVGIPAGVILSVIFRRRGKGKSEPVSSVAVVAFCIYAGLIVIITFLSRESGSRIGIDLELFSTWGINDRNNAYVIENVLLFIPYGFVSCWAFPGVRNFFFCTGIGAITSLGIEELQMITERGYFQIDDILTNIIGMIIGYILFRVVWWLRRKR